jgi:hypothetical protein
MHHIVFWKWKQPNFKQVYTSEHVNVMADMVLRNSRGLNTRLICVTDDPTGIDPKIDTFPLWNDFASLPNRSGLNLPSCYRRLKLFDATTQHNMGIQEGSRIVSMDIDTVVANELRPLLSKEEHFVGWAVRGAHHIRVFNGSMFMFTARQHQEIWSRFDPKSTPDRCHRAGYLGSDQSWLSYNFSRDPTAGTWSYPMAVSYPKEVARRPSLARGTAIVMFHGKRKPWQEDVQNESPWIKDHWRLGIDPAPAKVLTVLAQPGKAKVSV